MKYHIKHQTHYRYTQALVHSVHELRLTPRSSPLQTVLSWHVKVPGTLGRVKDGFGNIVETFTVHRSLARPVHSILIEAEGEIDVHPLDFAAPTFIEHAPAGETLVPPFYYLTPTPLTHATPAMHAFAQPYFAGGATPDSLCDLARAIVRQVAYASHSTHVGTKAAEAFIQGRGVCQDHAHIMLACCRAHGIPARYVSGYFYAAHAPDLASHAWVDVCVDTVAQRWVSVDVTHHCWTDTRHMRLAVGRDYQSAAPIRGVRKGGGDEQMDVNITITPLYSEMSLLK